MSWTFVFCFSAEKFGISQEVPGTQQLMRKSCLGRRNGLRGWFEYIKGEMFCSGEDALSSPSF